MIRHGSCGARGFLHRLTSRTKVLQEKSSEKIIGLRPWQSQSRQMSSSGRPEIPSFASQLASEISSGRGTGFIIGMFGLASAAIFLERWAEASRASDAQFMKHVDHVEAVLEPDEDLQEEVPEAQMDQVDGAAPSGSRSLAVEDGGPTQQPDTEREAAEQPGAASGAESAADSGPGLRVGTEESSEQAVLDAAEESGLISEEGKAGNIQEPDGKMSEEGVEDHTDDGGSLLEHESASKDGDVSGGSQEGFAESSDGDQERSSLLGEVKATGQELVEKATEAAGELLEGEGAPVDAAEEDECPFCQFMKGGPCREQFIKWEECVDDAEKQGVGLVEHCIEKTYELKICMEANTEYYGPVLEAEKGLEQLSTEQSLAETQSSQGEVESASTPAEPEAGREVPVQSGLAAAVEEQHAEQADGSVSREVFEEPAPLPKESATSTDG